MNNREALLLNGMAEELDTQIANAPNAFSGDRLRFAQMMLKRMAAAKTSAVEIDRRLAKGFNALIAEKDIAGSHLDPRASVAEVIRQSIDRSAAPIGEAWLREVVKLELQRREELEASSDEHEQSDSSRKSDPRGMITPERLTAYIRDRCDDPDVSVTDVTILPGGRSKWTAFIELRESKHFASSIVMRQDTGSDMIPTTVADEYPLLKALAELGMAVPRPLHFEPEHNNLGGPFMLMEKSAGTLAGDYFTGLTVPDPEVGAEIARFLGRLHSIDIGLLAEQNKTDEVTSEFAFKSLVQFFRARWLRDRVEISPLIECAYSWLLSRKDFGPPVCVHGDLGAHNFLVKDGHLEVVLDWEAQHVGDAGEDLGFCQHFIEKIMPWSEFMEHYQAAGGGAVSDERVLMGRMWVQVRNMTYSAGQAREYLDGSVTDFGHGAFSYSIFPLVEALLAPVLKEALKA